MGMASSPCHGSSLRRCARHLDPLGGVFFHPLVILQVQCCFLVCLVAALLASAASVNTLEGARRVVSSLNLIQKPHHTAAVLEPHMLCNACHTVVEAMYARRKAAYGKGDFNRFSVGLPRLCDSDAIMRAGYGNHVRHTCKMIMFSPHKVTFAEQFREEPSLTPQVVPRIKNFLCGNLTMDLCDKNAVIGASGTPVDECDLCRLLVGDIAFELQRRERTSDEVTKTTQLEFVTGMVRDICSKIDMRHLEEHVRAQVKDVRRDLDNHRQVEGPSKLRTVGAGVTTFHEYCETFLEDHERVLVKKAARTLNAALVYEVNATALLQIEVCADSAGVCPLQKLDEFGEGVELKHETVRTDDDDNDDDNDEQDKQEHNKEEL